MATVTIDGFDELMQALQHLPDHLVEKATTIVSDAADRMLTEATSGYPSGALQAGMVKTEQAMGRYGVGYQVKNRAPHAWWYEHGTETRHTAKGADRGAMYGGPKSPPGHVFIPAAERARPQMYRDLMAMLEAEGFEVTGSAT
jgi:hypothetical protein